MNTNQSVYGRDNNMVLAAMRYCLGRSSYIVSDCVEWLIWLWPQLDAKTNEAIRRDLEKEFTRDDESRALPRDENPFGQHPLGMSMDRTEWERVRALWK